METQQVTISRTYTFPAVPYGWDWRQNDDVVALFDDAGDRFGSVGIGSHEIEAPTLAHEAIEWQAAIDAEAAQAPVIEGQPVYVAIPLTLRRKGWDWLLNPECARLCYLCSEDSRIWFAGMTRQQAVDAMADLVSDAEVQP
jgi:hypothetical protein